ncbi:protein associated with UVRAG as autophagy enhancer isoform X2 [Mastomys coucha]|nr:protein associated with UVRAG as autophagy enhancer isoform X2 [Mastomys coucha]XP_031217771.1 protein associated with UVRAG as autophagy enhancer isoform X2 [Mastomys coucha]XP_031217774.1 protein associated with UVRAG as autophagy enhancer isoform X2 [Mastomys coucha]XP_031217775.1 protein associated with UVRAG as autophagy enhancer isoform X2 [Mastomys coucha]
MNSRIEPSGTTAIGELCFEHVHSIPGKMVSQSTGWGDYPVDPYEGTSRAFQDTDGLPSLLNTDQAACQLDVRFLRHKASWINPLCMQQPLQELCSQRPTVQTSENRVVVDTPSPLRLSILSSRNSLAEMPLSEDTADVICSNSAHCSGGKKDDFFLATEEQQVHPQQESLLKNPKTVATSPSPEEDGACAESPHLTASTDNGDAQSSSRSHAWNFFPLETFMLPAGVEKENLHFYAADMTISVIENMKCSLLSQQQSEIWGTGEASRSRGTGAEVTFSTHAEQEPGSWASSHTGCKGCAALQVSPVAETLSYCPVVGEACKHDLNKLVMLELGESKKVKEGCGCSYNSLKSATCESNLSPTGLLARELFRGFCKYRMLSEVNCRLPGFPTAASSGVGDEEHAEEDFDSSVDATQEVMLKSRVPGTEDWVPPRCQIILTVHPPIKRDIAVVAQNFFCAGCGTPIQPKFVKRLRYCEYLGKYFCDSCHSSAESCIPARILMMWDFRKYQVSDFSKWLLDSVWHQPVFNLSGGHHSLYAKAKELDRVKDIQEQLFHIKKLLKTCRFADSVLKEFEQVPSHLTDECHIFSMDDFLRTKKGLLAPLLKDILRASLAHVDSCELCQGKGFICEFCQSTTVIFPFQTTTCTRCAGCRACFHKQCFQSSRCPRCARMTARRQHLESLSPAAT